MRTVYYPVDRHCKKIENFVNSVEEAMIEGDLYLSCGDWGECEIRSSSWELIASKLGDEGATWWVNPAWQD
jgi:hypothetical protein